MMLPNLASSSFQGLTLLALLLVPLSQPVKALPAPRPQAEKKCTSDPCAVWKEWPQEKKVPYCWQGGLYCTISGLLTVQVGKCEDWCQPEPEEPAGCP